MTWDRAGGVLPVALIGDNLHGGRPNEGLNGSGDSRLHWPSNERIREQ